MLTSFRFHTSLLDNDTKIEIDNDENESGSENRDEEEGIYIEVSGKKDDKNLFGTAEEVASRFTAKELKDLCKSRGLIANGDKKSLAKRLLEESVSIES